MVHCNSFIHLKFFFHFLENTRKISKKSFPIFFSKTEMSCSTFLIHFKNLKPFKLKTSNSPQTELFSLTLEALHCGTWNCWKLETLQQLLPPPWSFTHCFHLSIYVKLKIKAWHMAQQESSFRYLSFSYNFNSHPHTIHPY